MMPQTWVAAPPAAAHHVRRAACRVQPATAAFRRSARDRTGRHHKVRRAGRPFAVDPHLRGHVLDDPGHERAHVVISNDGRRTQDRSALSDPPEAGSVARVLQALSGR
jgi:hypothetical protein